MTKNFVDKREHAESKAVWIATNCCYYQIYYKGKDDITMNEENRQICPNCQTGQNTYLLDSKNPFCNYIQCHNGKTCSMYVPIKNKEDNT